MIDILYRTPEAPSNQTHWSYIGRVKPRVRAKALTRSLMSPLPF